MRNPECPPCAIEENPLLVQLAERVEKVYVSAALATAESFDEEDAIRTKTITPEDINRLAVQIRDDANLSLIGCFAILHEAAWQDKATLGGLVDETRIALAACATRRLQRTCYLEGFRPGNQNET